MKLALHQSIIFWAGLLVMVFVCWAWRDSTKTSSYALTGKLEIQSEGSAVRCTSYADQPSMWTAGRQEMAPYFASGGYPEVLGDFRFAQPEFVRFPGDVELLNTWYETGELNGRRLDPLVDQFLQDPVGARLESDWLLLIPHWLILLAVIALWLGLLFWRARRRARAAKGISG